MEYLNYLLMGLVIFFLAQRLLPVKGVRQISIAELKKELKDNSKQLIDVRTHAEFTTSHIRGFKNIPLNQISKKANELNKEKEIILICHSGARSNQASRIIKKLGFKQVTNVKGGIRAWE